MRGYLSDNFFPSAFPASFQNYRYLNFRFLRINPLDFSSTFHPLSTYSTFWKRSSTLSLNPSINLLHLCSKNLFLFSECSDFSLFLLHGCVPSLVPKYTHYGTSLLGSFHCVSSTSFLLLAFDLSFMFKAFLLWPATPGCLLPLQGGALRSRRQPAGAPGRSVHLWVLASLLEGPQMIVSLGFSS